MLIAQLHIQMVKMLQQFQKIQKQRERKVSVGFLSIIRKFQLLLTSKGEATIKTGDANIKSSSSKKLIGVLTYNKLTFNKHVSKLSKKASNKLDFKIYD